MQMTVSGWFMRTYPSSALNTAKAPIQPLVFWSNFTPPRPGGLASSGGEHYYMQAALSGALAADVDFSLPIFSLLGADASAAGGTVSQPPRLWLSAAGAESPMHFDRSSSFLAHVRGTKRMVFVPPNDLAALQPFPEGHLLARRTRFAATGGVQAEADRLAQVPGLQVVLQPGDVVFFGPFWAHYTLSETQCVSVTCRFSGAA